ncbi:MAG: NUDIX hydrolase [Patescibacteria group bacterium]|jgi:ADP-ribose pyrophosphatase YjhB (NUDIX family)
MNKHPNDFYKFCPKCGGALKKMQHDRLERLVCGTCNFIFYQNPKAAVCAIIENDRGEVLLVKRAEEPHKGMLDIPGGFVNFGEEPRTALIREMAEELHVAFTPQQCTGTYHCWYEAQGLKESIANIYYTGTIIGELRPDDDITDAQWFPLTSLPDDIADDHIRRALEDYKKEENL